MTLKESMETCSTLEQSLQNKIAYKNVITKQLDAKKVLISSFCIDSSDRRIKVIHVALHEPKHNIFFLCAFSSFKRPAPVVDTPRRALTPFSKKFSEVFRRHYMFPLNT